jgi:hypothetical protein
VQGPRPRPGLKEEGVLCCTVLVNCTDYGLVLLYGYGTEFCFGIGGGGRHWLLLQAFPGPDPF